MFTYRCYCNECGKQWTFKSMEPKETSEGTIEFDNQTHCPDCKATDVELYDDNKKETAVQPMQIQGEMVMLRFEDDLHKRLHNVLMDYKFSFTVNHDLTVGRIYNHDKKPIRVRLQEGDDHLEFRALDTTKDEIITDEYYTRAEFAWLTHGLGDDEDSEVELLRRELEIIINIRPHTMNSILGTP